MEIAKKMSDLVLDKYLSNNELHTVRVCDLSIGSGNLLVPILEKLIKFSYKIYGEYRYNENWITGYDIDDTYEAKYNLEKVLKKYNLKGKINISQRDALYIENKKFNIIIGNPPYMGEKNNKEIFKKLRESPFGKKYYIAKMDYLYYFIHRGIEVLEPNGYLIYLTTNYWLKSDSGHLLRQNLRQLGQFTDMYFYNVSLFENNKGQANIIFMWQKNVKNDMLIRVEKEDDFFEIRNSEIYVEDKIILSPYKFKNIFEKSNYKLGDLVNINQGIITGYDKAFIFNEYDNQFAEFLKPFYKNKDINKYTYNSPKYYMLYFDKLDDKLYNHLIKFYNKLSARREVRRGIRKWYEITWKRDDKIFKSEKIVVRQRCKNNRFAYSDGEFYGSADIYYLTKKDEDVNLFYILGYLNSDIYMEYVRIYGKSKGVVYEFYTTPLKDSPICYPKNNKKELNYISTLVKMQIKEYNEEIQEKINRYFDKIFNE